MAMTATSAGTCAEPAGVAGTLSWDDSARRWFLAQSQKAAALERGGAYYQASEVWGECRVLAATSVERFWCEVRQARCLKQASGVNAVHRRGHQP
ncbi:ANR family transcriptional regulator [Serratia ureilytica]|uniref:ANR family transcriptional regulator n=2 Tax=Serratia TaxID=613 RepID=A0A9X9BZA9_9GAMM|nr:ANR family transcriptional regulator [Serratia ureilytica]